MQTDLLIPLFPAPQAGPVVVPKTQEVVVGHQALDGVADHIDVDGLLLYSKPASKQRARVRIQLYRDVRPEYYTYIV